MYMPWIYTGKSRETACLPYKQKGGVQKKEVDAYFDTFTSVYIIQHLDKTGFAPEVNFSTSGF